MSDVPDEATGRKKHPAEAADPERWNRWKEAVASSMPGWRLADCMALADAEVAAERQRLHDRIEAVIDELQALPECWYSGYITVRRDSVHRLLRALVSEASASPVSDDTGGTK